MIVETRQKIGVNQCQQPLLTAPQRDCHLVENCLKQADFVGTLGFKPLRPLSSAQSFRRLDNAVNRAGQGAGGPRPAAEREQQRCQ